MNLNNVVVTPLVTNPADYNIKADIMNDEFVKVADFGLARVLHDNLELTQTGMALGTPLYMSPEQSHGGKVDIRGDLYSLGATAYHLVTGQPPFRGTTGVAVALAHAKEPLELLRTVRPDFPVEVAGVIERLLEKDKESRFQTSSELLEAVEPLVAQATSSSRATALPLAWNPETSFGQTLLGNILILETV